MRGKDVRRAVLVAVVLGGCGCSSAMASWTPPQALPSLRVPQVVVGGAAGEAAVVAQSEDGAIVASGHVPGGSWSAPAALVGATGTGEDGTTGPGGAFASHTPAGQLLVGHIGPSGAVVGPIASVAAGDVTPQAVATAPDGTVLAVVTDDAGALTAYRVAPGGAAATNAGTLAPADVEEASVAATGEPGAFAIVWTDVPDVGTSDVRGRLLAPSGPVGSTATLSTGTDASTTVGDPEVAGTSGTAVAAWTQTGADGNGSFARVRALNAASAPLRLAGAGAVAGVTVTAGPGPSYLVSYTSASRLPASGGAVVVPPSAGTPTCAVPRSDAVAAGAARPEGFSLLGLDQGAQLGGAVLAPVAPACSAAPLSAGPGFPDADTLAVGVDAERSTVAVVTTDATSGLLTYDDVPPALGQPRLPTDGRPGARVAASVDAADAWGLGEVIWSVDGREAARGVAVQLPAQEPGRHAISVRATDAAGNASTQEAELQVASEPTPTPTTTATEPTPTTTTATTTTSVAPPPPPVSVAVAPVQTAPVAVAAPGPPLVLGARIVGRGGRTRVVVRTSGAVAVRLALVRETYTGGRGRPSRCTGRARHGRPGLAAPYSISKAGATATIVVLSAAMRRALRTRGRYRLGVVAVAPDGRRSPTRDLRFTRC